MGGHEVEERVAKYLRRQHGAVSRAQVLAAGGSDALIRSRLRSGKWVRMASGVYASSAVQPTWHRQVMAATLIHDGLVAAAGSTAAVLYGADGFRPGRPQLLVAHGAGARNPLASVHRSRHLLATDVGRIKGIPVLKIERLIVDLATSLGEVELGRMVDRAAILKSVDPDVLLDRAGHVLSRNRAGMRLLGEIVAQRWTGHPAAMSVLEDELYELLDAAGYGGSYIRQAVPPWFKQARGGVVLDTLFPDDRVILEADGRLWHARLEQWERDLNRMADALAHGYMTVRVTYRMVHNSPRTVLAALQPWIRCPAVQDVGSNWA